jgi:superfamily I DNA/RNA helicase
VGAAAGARPRAIARRSATVRPCAVDEYQDTNPLQSRILRALCTHGRITVVGDDAQSIYSFRGATIRNILDFPQQFPGTRIVTLERNYRSTSPIPRYDERAHLARDRALFQEPLDRAHGRRARRGS